MKKHLVALLIGIHFLAFSTMPRVAVSQDNLPKEKVIVHTDKPFYVTGETIWFKANCLDATQPEMQSLSKVLYMEMINKDGSAVKQVKVALENGSGNGQILVTPDLVSDKYQLRAYTSWMKNFGEESFSTQELSVINPSAPPVYEVSQLGRLDGKSSQASSSAKNTGVLSISKKAFTEKEKVTLSLNPTISGNLSLSVYKYNRLLEDDSRFLQKQWSAAKATGAEVVYPPEVRAPLVSGKITSADSLPKNLYAVFTGSESDMYYITVDESGEFTFEVSPNLENKELLFWSSSMPLDPEAISIDNPFLLAGEKDLKLQLDTTLQSFLEDNIFNIQASHAYDTLSNIMGKATEPEPYEFFYGRPDAYYLLDDFTRFTTIRETIIEYVREAFMKKNKLAVLYTRSNKVFDSPALVLLDGVPVTEDSLIMNFNPKKVKSIETINDHFILGTEIFYGIINFITFEKDYGNIPSSYLVEKPYQELLQSRTFFSPSYDDSETNRLPDFRNTLHWEPNIELNDDQKKEISFYTSMSTGTYKVELAGITKDGRPFLEEGFFEVIKRSD